MGGIYVLMGRQVEASGREMVEWLLLLHNFIQLTLKTGSAQVQILLAACGRFAMVSVSDNALDWKLLLLLSIYLFKVDQLHIYI